MGYCRLGLAAVAALGLLTTAAPAGSAGVSMPTGMHADASALARPVAFYHHGRRTQSYYCYPKNYWWFYRPYTTAYDGHARCMPYFHYLEPRQGGKSGRFIK